MVVLLVILVKVNNNKKISFENISTLENFFKFLDFFFHTKIAFFRRKVLCHKQMQCTKSGQCEINKANRKGCKLCRLQKCFEIGMKAEWVMTEEDKHEQEETARIKREQRSNSDVNGVLTTYQKRMR